MREMSKEEAMEAFKELIESEDVVEVEVRKIYVDENNSHRSMVVIKAILKG